MAKGNSRRNNSSNSHTNSGSSTSNSTASNSANKDKDKDKGASIPTSPVSKHLSPPRPESTSSPNGLSTLASTVPQGDPPSFEQFTRELASELSLPDLSSDGISPDVRSAIERLQREIFNISMTLSMTRKAGYQLVDVGRKLEIDKQTADRELAATKHKLTLVDAETVDLRKACKDCRSTLGSMRSELQQAREEIKQRRAMESEFKATKAKFSSCMSNMEQECDKLRKECTKLKEHNDQLLAQLKAAKKTLENAEKTLSASAQRQSAQGTTSSVTATGGVVHHQQSTSHQPYPPATINNTTSASGVGKTTILTPQAVHHAIASKLPSGTTRQSSTTISVPTKRATTALAAAAAAAASSNNIVYDRTTEYDEDSELYDDGEEDEEDEEEDASEYDVNGHVELDGEEEEDDDEVGDEDEDGVDGVGEDAKSYNDLARDFLRSLEIKDYAGFCSNVAHLVTHEHAQQVNDWNALAIGALWLIALAGDCHAHSHVQSVIESLPDVRRQHPWVLQVAQLHEYVMANEPRDFFRTLEQVGVTHMVKQVAPLRDILNALRILQRIRFLNAFFTSEYHSNRFKRSNQVSLRMALFKTDFKDTPQLRQWLERELEGSETQLMLTGGGKNLGDVRTLKAKLHDKLKGAENTYKKALEYLTTSLAPVHPGQTLAK